MKEARTFQTVYRCVMAEAEQHGHMSEHAQSGEGNRRKALCVHHVGIVPVPGVSKNMAWLSPIAPFKMGNNVQI